MTNEEKAKELRAKFIKEYAPLIEPETGDSWGGGGCSHDNEESRALIVLLLSMMPYEKLLELWEGIHSPELCPEGRVVGDVVNGYLYGPDCPSDFQRDYYGPFKCGDFVIPAGGLLNGMPDGWKLDERND